MESLYILIPIAIFIVAIAVLLFLWSVKNGQYTDLEAEGKRILFDDMGDQRSTKKNADEHDTDDGKKN